MAVTLAIKLGDNTFNVDGEFEFTEFLSDMFRAWVNAQSEEGADLDALTTSLRTSTTGLKSTVDSHQP